VSLEPEPQITIDEQRARIRRWTRFAAWQQIVGGDNQGGGRCMICERLIGPSELDFIITFKGAVSLRLDAACLELWREETLPPPAS
jgi:hypothetical protein